MSPLSSAAQRESDARTTALLNRTPEEMGLSPVPVVKLYYFNPNTYGQEWFVAAHSREEAIAAVKAHVIAQNAEKHFNDDVVEPGEVNDPRWLPRTAEQKRAEDLQDDLETLDLYISGIKRDWDRKPRCIEEHPIGKVIQTEIS